MTPAPSARQPGDMTVPLLFGWEGVAVVVTFVLLLGVVAFLLLAAGRGGRSEWQTYLEGRSIASPDPTDAVPAADAPDRSPHRRR
jgi:hypothetical protein